MKIFIICSTSFYNKIESIKEKLLKKGHTLIMPNSYGEEENDVDFTKMTEKEYQDYFSKMYHLSRTKISKIDAVLVLNYDKEKNGQVYHNYIGAATFLEMYEAFMQNKKIYILNDYPDNILLDEIKGFAPIVLNGNLDKIV